MMVAAPDLFTLDLSFDHQFLPGVLLDYQLRHLHIYAKTFDASAKSNIAQNPFS